MPITKNHATRNTVSMMYSVVKDDDVEMFNRVVDLKGDIYDYRGNGSFFPRALSNNSHKVIAAYLKRPDFKGNMAKYRPADFYYAITNGDIEALKTLASLNLDKNTLCVKAIMRDSSLANSDKFMLKASILAFLIDPEYFQELNSTFINKNLFLLALTVRDLSSFDFLFQNKEAMGITLGMTALGYLVSRSCYASDSRANSSEFLASAYACLDIMLNDQVWEVDTIQKSGIELAYSFKLILGEPIDTDSNAHWRFFDHLVVNHPESAVTQVVLADFYAQMLSHLEVYGDYIELHQDAFSKMQGQMKTFSIDNIAPMLANNNALRFCEKEARRVASLALSTILIESGIDTSDILNTIQVTGKESKVIKKAVVLKSIEEKGIHLTISNIRHISYINAVIELGHDPYELLTHVGNDKIAQKLTEMLMNS